MPKFTLTKHAEGAYDSTITSEFYSNYLDCVKEHVEDFLLVCDLQGNSPLENWLEAAEDKMWDEAFEFKFADTETHD